MSVQELARSLAAAGSTKLPGDEEGIYLLHVDNENLVEKLWIGDSAKYETVIASDAKKDTSASYLLYHEQNVRLVVFIDQSNAVQCYAYNMDTEEWDKTALGEKWNITTSPKSKLSASFDHKGGIVVSYQDMDGSLAGVMSLSENNWDKFGPLEADPVVGTPLCLETIDNKLHLFYIGKDSGVRFLVLDSDKGQWQASVTVLENTMFDTPISNFSIAKNPKSDSFQSYFLTDGSMWTIEGEKRTRFGRVEGNGKLIPTDNAQAGWTVWWRGARYVEATPYMVRIWY